MAAGAQAILDLLSMIAYCWTSMFSQRFFFIFTFGDIFLNFTLLAIACEVFVHLMRK